MKTIGAASPQDIAEFLQEQGYRAKLELGSDGDPLVRSAAHGVNYTIFCYNTDDRHRNPKTIQYALMLGMDGRVGPAVINRWNMSKRWTSAALDDESDPVLTLDVPLLGGIPEPLFQFMFDRWTSSVGEFLEHVGWN